jgi:hypothetical protein
MFKSADKRAQIARVRGSFFFICLFVEFIAQIVYKY